MITNEQLLDWINQMPLWFRKAVDIYYKNNEVTDLEIKKLADCCLSDDTDYKVKGINLINYRDKRGFVINSIDSIKGVNALDLRNPLVFGEKGITVVYGLNGAGKSGYIRIFKMISGAKYREDIKNNIYTEKQETPMATIKLTYEDGTNSTYECDLKKPGQYKDLRDIDIFDTKISNAYVNEAKEATYEPWVFGMFSYLAEVANRIKSELKNRESEYSVQKYAFPESLLDSEQYKKIKEISYKSKIEDFPEIWSEEEEKKLNDLRINNQVETIQAKLKQLESEIKAKKSLRSYFEVFELYFKERESYIELKEEWDQAANEKKAAELLFSNNASEIDANSVTLDVWKKLWMYARQYSESNEYMKNNSAILKRGGKCPLCMQDINSEEVYDRISTIDSYVNGRAIEKERKAHKAFSTKVELKYQIKSKDDLLLLIETSGLGEIKEKFVEANNSLADYSKYIVDNEEYYDGRVVELVSVIDLLNSKLLEDTEAVNEMKGLLESDEQKVLKQQIDELEAQKYLVSNYPVIKNNIFCLQEIHKLQQAEKKTTTNKITLKSKELAQEMITEDYINRFDSELKNLTKNSIEVTLSQQRAGSGKIPYKVVLNDAFGNQISPKDILSEGENRVTSLAAFFAESSGRSETTPLIVDDPISSLDYLYEEKVIDRLVKASLNRQVIVFTHRISMVVGLADKAKEYEVKYNEISLKSNKHIKGVPANYSDIGTKAKGLLNDLITRKFHQLKKMDEFSDEYKTLFHNICQEFRNIVEKSIEDVLINEVVKRFRRDIQTKNRLEKLANISIEDCQMFDKLMTRYSYYDHSMSDETPLIELTIEELEEDLLGLQTWINSRK